MSKDRHLDVEICCGRQSHVYQILVSRLKRSVNGPVQNLRINRRQTRSRIVDERKELIASYVIATGGKEQRLRFYLADLMNKLGDSIGVVRLRRAKSEHLARNGPVSFIVQSRSSYGDVSDGVPVI